MAKIFGISKNPVSTIDKALQPFKLPEPCVKYLSKKNLPIKNTSDIFVVSENTSATSKFAKMRSGAGRMMARFRNSNKVK